MSSIDHLYSFISNEAKEEEIRNEKEESFMNGHEDSILQILSDVEKDDFFETQAIERAFISLRSDKRYARYSQADIDSMYNLVRRYIHLMGTAYMPSKTSFRIDDMSERSIEVRFNQRADVSLNLYISELQDDMADYDETYITYVEGNKSIIANDTMDGMVTLVKKLIGE